jgi:DNA-binding Xre family transcriptional regulator
MISGSGLKRLMVEKDLSVELLSQVSGIDCVNIRLLIRGARLSKKVINTLCKTLSCQPCDIIEYTPDDKPKPHWEWIE